MRMISMVIVLAVSAAVTVSGIRLVKVGPTPLTSTLPATVDPTSGGTWNGANARLELNKKSLEYASTEVGNALNGLVRSVAMPDWTLPLGAGQLTIKTLKITEFIPPKYTHELLPPNSVALRAAGGKMRMSGGWNLKMISAQIPETNGELRTTVSNLNQNITLDWARDVDGRPTIRDVRCVCELGDFRMEIVGVAASANLNLYEKVIGDKIRQFFQESICQISKTFFKESLNAKLKTFQTRVNVYNDNRFVIDYSVMNDASFVDNESLHGNLKGEMLGVSRFAGPALRSQKLNKDFKQAAPEKMLTFMLGDSAFNSLFRQAYTQQFWMSAIELLNNSSALFQQLQMSCGAVGKCLGNVFPAVSSVGKYGSIGDLVMKVQRRPPTIWLAADKARLDASGVLFEVYAIAKDNNRRELLGRIEAKKLIGEFTPKYDSKNITGSVVFDQIEFTKATPISRAVYRTITDETLTKFTDWAGPIITEMFNQFLTRYATFPIPLVNDVECVTATLRRADRTVQIDCDIRVSRWVIDI